MYKILQIVGMRSQINDLCEKVAARHLDWERVSERIMVVLSEGAAETLERLLEDEIIDPTAIDYEIR